MEATIRVKDIQNGDGQKLAPAGVSDDVCVGESYVKERKKNFRVTSWITGRTTALVDLTRRDLFLIQDVTSRPTI